MGIARKEGAILDVGPAPSITRVVPAGLGT